MVCSAPWRRSALVPFMRPAPRSGLMHQGRHALCLLGFAMIWSLHRAGEGGSCSNSLSPIAPRRRSRCERMLCARQGESDAAACAARAARAAHGASLDARATRAANALQRGECVAARRMRCSAANALQRGECIAARRTRCSAANALQRGECVAARRTRCNAANALQCWTDAFEQTE